MALDDGLAHASQAIDGLGATDVTNYVMANAIAVLRAVPEMERARSSVIEYRERLALPPAEGTA
jgi:hypothetical protein